VDPAGSGIDYAVAMAAAPPDRKPRRRRTAEAARAAILDATERRLIEAGPGAVRLQQVAADLGVSHPTVLHHFGSREALVRAVVERAFARLQADVIDAIARTPPPEVGDGEAEVAAMFERVFAALGARGQGRALAWLALSGLADAPLDLRLRQVAAAAHAVRRRRRGARTPPYEDTLYTVLLAASALFAQSVAGPMLARSAGLSSGPRADARFRKWLARLVVRHLKQEGA
jgi:AcrR family transcriptional regulator